MIEGENPLAVINTLAWRMGYHSYLELGIRRPEENFDRVTADIKHSVDIDPAARAMFTMSCDAFFASGLGLAEYDLIYIDADHRERPALRDMANSVMRLAHRGTVVCDNVLPDSAQETRCGASGEIWKAYAIMRMSRPDLFMYVIDIPFGLGVIRHGRQAMFVSQEAGYLEWKCDELVDYEFYVKYWQELMNVVSLDEFWGFVDGWELT